MISVSSLKPEDSSSLNVCMIAYGWGCLTLLSLCEAESGFGELACSSIALLDDMHFWSWIPHINAFWGRSRRQNCKPWTDQMTYCDSDCAQAAAEVCVAGAPIQTWKARNSNVHAQCPLRRTYPECVKQLGSMAAQGKAVWFKHHIAMQADETWKDCSMTEGETHDWRRNRHEITCWNYSHPLQK